MKAGLNFCVPANCSTLTGRARPECSLSVASTSNTGPTSQDVVTGDFNVDGITDLLVANTGAASASLYLGNGAAGVGNGTFPASGLLVTVGQQPRNPSVADWNGDGVPDFAVANNTSNKTASVVTGKGNGTFNPALTAAPAWTGSVDGFTQQAGRYSPSTNYTVNVALLNEQFTWPDGGPRDNNFAAVFEDASGNRVGTLTTDTNISTSNCPTARPVPGPTTGTTYMYRNCDVIFSRFPATGLSGWSFTWRSPADAGVVTMFLGAVDGNANDRTRGRDGGPDDDVVMGKVVLAP